MPSSGHGYWANKEGLLQPCMVETFALVNLLISDICMHHINPLCAHAFHADAGQRRKLPAGALSQLFAWANAATLPRASTTPTPSQPSTPRRMSKAANEGGISNSDVVRMLEAFSGNGGMQF